MRSRRSILFWGVLFFVGPFSVAAAEQVRESVIAGSWYPGDAAVLRRQIDSSNQVAKQMKTDRKLKG